MKCFYWNLRGLANSPTKLALKKLLVKHKPDICFLAEPWMHISNFSQRWLNNLGLKVFVVNDRNTLIPNLWCLCKNNLYPTLLNTNDQSISITFDVAGKIFGVTAVYASTCYIKRRSLWAAITHLQSQHDIPWSCIGDFNAILGSHEQRSQYSPSRVAMEEFQQWSDYNNLIHLHTRGASYTWSNGRKGRYNIQRRLDRVIVNHKWITAASTSNVSTLTKLRSDHYPLLFQFNNQNIQHNSTFKFLKVWTEHPDCINIIRQSWNTQITGCPMYVLTQKLKLLKDKLKAWNLNTFGNIHSHVNTANQLVDDIQEQIDRTGYTDDLLEQEKNAQLNLENAFNLEEIFWKEKSKVK